MEQFPSPNDPLSSRGRGTDSAPQKGVMRPRSAAATGSARTAPNKAATTGLPHHGPRRDCTPAGQCRRAAEPPRATAAPRRRGRSGAPSGHRRLRRCRRPSPLPLLTTICQRPRTRTPSACECRTPRSAAGAAGRQRTSESLTAAPVCCSGWFGTDCAEQSRDDRTTASRPQPRPDPPAGGPAAPPLRPRAAATGTPRRRGRSAPSGCRLRRRQRPGPLPPLTTTCQRQRARTLSAVECRTPRSAAGAAEQTSYRARANAAPVCCSGWFGTDALHRMEAARRSRTTPNTTTATTPAPRPARPPKRMPPTPNPIPSTDRHPQPGDLEPARRRDPPQDNGGADDGGPVLGLPSNDPRPLRQPPLHFVPSPDPASGDAEPLDLLPD